jgi:hypothetical protein
MLVTAAVCAWLPAEVLRCGAPFSPGELRANFSGCSSTMYIFGMKKQHSVTVALRITHMHRLEIWI